MSVHGFLNLVSGLVAVLMDFSVMSLGRWCPSRQYRSHGKRILFIYISWMTISHFCLALTKPRLMRLS